MISRKNIHSGAVKVLYRLRDAGFSAYLVGGGVRDLLLGLRPKDFDVATDAHPEQIRKLFSNSRVIGRRFRLVHVVFGREIVEVSTFRKTLTDASEEHHQNEHGMMLRDNAFGKIDDDAVRRDFTVNALYYDINDFSVVDYVGGVKDLRHRLLRLIGDPEVRFREDPVRMLRALRLAGKLNFHLAEDLQKAIPKMKDLLGLVSKARLFDEVNKIFVSGRSKEVFALLQKYSFVELLFPAIKQTLIQESHNQRFINLALTNTDQRLVEGKTVNPAFMIAVLYWPVVMAMQAQYTDVPASRAFDLSCQRAVHFAVQGLAIPRRITQTVRDMWHLQHRFASHRANVKLMALTHPKFRAAYDFLLLRAEVDESLHSLAVWWTSFYEANSEQREEMLKQQTAGVPKPRRRRRNVKKKVE